MTTRLAVEGADISEAWGELVASVVVLAKVGARLKLVVARETSMGNHAPQVEHGFASCGLPSMGRKLEEDGREFARSTHLPFLH